MKEKFINNLLMNFLITFIVGILGFIVNKYFVKYLGAEMLGLMKLFTQLIAYLNLAELGLTGASTYALYKPLLEKNIIKINVIMSTIDFFYKRISCLIFIGGIFFMVGLPYFIDINLFNKKIYIYWILYVFNTAIGYLFAKYTILFTANQEYGYIRKIQGFGKGVCQIIQIVIIIKYRSFFLFILIMILENIYNIYFFNKHLKRKYFYIEKVKDRDGEIIKSMKNLFIHKISSLIVFNTDYILLSKFTNLYIVGIYSSYLMVNQIIITILGTLTSVLTPKIGFFIAKNDKNKIYRCWKELNYIYIYMITVVIFCTYKLIIPFVILWLGKEFILPILTIKLILLNLFINLSSTITYVFKVSCGFFEDIYTPILESFINLFISLILVQKFGLNGVIIGTLVSNITILFLLKPILVFKKCFDKNAFDYIKIFVKILILVSLSIISIEKLILLINLDLDTILTWIEFIEKAFYLVILSIFVSFLIFIFDKNFRIVIKKIGQNKNII